MGASAVDCVVTTGVTVAPAPTFANPLRSIWTVRSAVSLLTCTIVAPLPSASIAAVDWASELATRRSPGWM